MATALAYVPGDGTAPAPPEMDGAGAWPFPTQPTPEAAAARAKQVYERHRRGKQAYAPRRLMADKLLAHLSGDMWVDIWRDQLIPITPWPPGSSQDSENVLATLVANACSYLFGTKFSFNAQARADRRGRRDAVIASALANDVASRQDLTSLFMAAWATGGCCYGHGIVHLAWRDDLSSDPYDPLYDLYGEPDASVEGSQMGAQGVAVKGFVDLWLGDPWSTVYDPGCTRYQTTSFSYERQVTRRVLVAAFEDVLLAQGKKPESVKGRKDTEVSRFQRTQAVLRSIGSQERGGLGVPVIGGADPEEVCTIIVHETEKGQDRDFPGGRCTIVLLDGGGEVERGASGTPILLYEGPCPGGVTSAVRVYGTGPYASGDDVLGAPWLLNLDELQCELNALKCRRSNYLRKWSEPPIIAQGAFANDDAKQRPWDTPVWEMYGGSAAVLEPPQSQGTIDAAIQDVRSQMYAMGGYGSASRGEQMSGTSGYAVQQLASNDDSIFRPVAQEHEKAACLAMQKAYMLVRAHLTMPWLLENAGDDAAYIMGGFIHRSQLSDQPPHYQVVSFQGSAENFAAQLERLLPLTDAAGTPLMTVEDFKRQFPFRGVLPEGNDVATRKRQRAIGCAEALRTLVEQYRAQTGAQPGDPRDEQAAQELFQALESNPATARRRDDDVQAHLDELSSITQDFAADPVAVTVAEWRQDQYYAAQQAQYDQQMAAQQPQAPEEQGAYGEMGTPQAGAGALPQGQPPFDQAQQAAGSSSYASQ